MANYLIEKYDYVLKDLGDPRVQDWVTVSSPIPTLIIIAFYLLIVYVILPAFMANRKPFNLKTTLKYYNIFQIVYCFFLIYGISTSGWTTTYSLKCQPVDYSTNPEALRMLNWVYLTYVIKGIEMVETFMFILRKKYNQVSKLHVYHHTSTFFLGWIGVKYVAGGMATFPVIINSFIHIFMYTYYLFSSLGPEWQKKLQKWKPRLTMFQMFQFCIIIAHSLQALHPDCKVPKQLLLIYVPNIVLIFYMFWNFYKKNYLMKSKKI